MITEKEPTSKNFELKPRTRAKASLFERTSVKAEKETSYFDGFARKSYSVHDLELEMRV